MGSALCLVAVSLFGLSDAVPLGSKIGLFQWMAGTPGLLYLGATLIGFNFGGNFALFPTITADTFGSKYVGMNYGWVFLAYAIGGIFGPILGGKLGDMGNFPLAFTICGILCIVAVLTISLVKPADPKQLPVIPFVVEVNAADPGGRPDSVGRPSPSYRIRIRNRGRYGRGAAGCMTTPSEPPAAAGTLAGPPGGGRSTGRYAWQRRLRPPAVYH